MENHQTILKAHAWLRELKALKNLNYDYIAGIIGYSGVGVSKALKNETFKLEQIKVIAKHEGVLDDFEMKVMGIDGVMEPMAEYASGKNLGVFLNKNHEALLNSDATYQMWFDKMVSLEAMKMIKDLISNK